MKDLIAISGCGQLSVLRIALCLQISDEGLVHVAKYCPNIVELDFYRCTGITDMGVTAIAGGCPRLQSINLGYCTRITDGSLRSLSKCSDLNILGIRGCPLVSSSGLTAIALGCRKLAELDIRKCYSMNDAGMLLLARVSQNLREINLSYCSVTDVGVLALASISCLQIMAIVHVGGLTPHGLATALSACGGLRKVKLNSLFKPLLPRPLLERLAACGCVLQWRDKTLQFGVESSEVWKRKSQEMLAFVVATSDP